MGEASAPRNCYKIANCRIVFTGCFDDLVSNSLDTCHRRNIFSRKRFVEFFVGEVEVQSLREQRKVIHEVREEIISRSPVLGFGQCPTHYWEGQISYFYLLRVAACGNDGRLDGFVIIGCPSEIGVCHE